MAKETINALDKRRDNLRHREQGSLSQVISLKIMMYS
jgi:hypothetical protein